MNSLVARKIYIKVSNRPRKQDNNKRTDGNNNKKDCNIRSSYT